MSKLTPLRFWQRPNSIWRRLVNPRSAARTLIGNLNIYVIFIYVTWLLALLLVT